MSVAIFAALCAMPERTFITKESSFRVYVCPATGMQLGTPIFSAIFFSSARTFSPSPWKRARKLAAVPVAPLHPEMGRRESSVSSCSKSSRKSCSQSVARLPTVVGCAAWKCVQASVGVSASRAANSESASITASNSPRMSFSAARICRRSVLSST